ncbi:transmembrane protein UsgS [Teratosphaeria nubilosa]|uniref:Transmembrane protein UsgS n=1 Tax=Teratosphaeria nubilosa TaxID=161662 RepID=A0A6G1LCK6_9PEZI|nr:transmembrane protein UsgS [Teratosphaeria nubilosa]
MATHPDLHTLLGALEPNAILRGAQLTLVGASRALQNPRLFTTTHYRQALLAVALGLAIRLLVALPTLGIRVLIKCLCLLADCRHSTFDEDVIEGIEYVEHSVLQVPFFMMTLIRYLSPAMDQMFMDSLAWVDRTYIEKHTGRGEDVGELRAMYAENLRLYGVAGSEREKKEHRNPYEALMKFLMRFGRKAGLSLAVYLLSFVPYVGRFVLPAASFWTFNKAVGLAPAVVVFGSGVFLPRRYLVFFLQSYFGSRTLMRELLEPYFSRVHYTPEQKRQWFKDREGVLYGFALAFFIILRVPLLGVLIYGVAEASTAYLITKITAPPPPPQYAEEFKRQDVRWENKHDFLSLPMDALDKLNFKAKSAKARPDTTGMSSGNDIKPKQFS